MKAAAFAVVASLLLATAVFAQELKLDVTVPEQVDEHTICVVQVDTNAKFSSVTIMQSLFESVDCYKLEPTKDEQRQRYVWTGKPGAYRVEVNVYDPEMGVSKVFKKVVVGKVTPIPDPDPNPDPDPDPNPDPDPDPDPDPQPDPTPPADFQALTVLIPKLAANVDQDDRIGQAKILADAFDEFAAKTGQYETIADFTIATSDKYKQALGAPLYQSWSQNVLAPLADELRKLRDAGSLSKLEQYGPAWKAIAAGFREVK